jgi:hypothetical protein
LWYIDKPHRIICRAGRKTVTRAEEFRAKAAECDRLADEAIDLEAKRMLREAANNWWLMADQAERLGW